MWMFYANLGAVGWALVHVMDSYCVNVQFERPYFGVITSSLATAVVMLPLLPFVDNTWTTVHPGSLALAILCGGLIQLSQVCYFQALHQCDAGVVAAYWNLEPALLPVISFAFLGRVFAPLQYFGIAALVLASVCLCLLDSNRSLRWRSFMLMVVANAFHIAAALALDMLYIHIPYEAGMLGVTIGIVLTGSAILISPCVRATFNRNRQQLLKAAPLFVVIELINLAALACSQKALDLGIPTFVSAIEASIPAYTMVLTLVIVRAIPSLSSADTKRSQHVLPRFLCVGVMAASVGLL